MKLCDLVPEEVGTWENKTIIEIDVDWAHDDVIADTVELISEFGVETTWFATHKSAALDNIRNHADFEIGIHPNFMPLLRGDSSLGASYDEVIDRLCDIYPEAKCSKGHALVDSSAIISHLTSAGITHDNTMFIDAPVMRPLAPWRLWTGMVRAPLCWEDDYACVSPYKDTFSKLLKDESGLKIFGFHPLHVYLNTESLDRYERVKEFSSDPAKLKDMRYEGTGTRTRFIELLKAVSEYKVARI